MQGYGGAYEAAVNTRPNNAYQATYMPQGHQPKQSQRGNPRAEFSVQDLDRLDKVLVIVAAIGLIVNIVQMAAMSNHAWLRATALNDGQPFTAHLSLSSAKFGEADRAGSDNKYFCPKSYSDECTLHSLCYAEYSDETFENGMLKTTPASAWCEALAAGSLTTKTLFFGLLLGLAATGFTGMYAAQSVPWVADQFDQIEEMGFTDDIQK
jgi:hypothetical protein